MMILNFQNFIWLINARTLGGTSTGPIEEMEGSLKIPKQADQTIILLKMKILLNFFIFSNQITKNSDKSHVIFAKKKICFLKKKKLKKL